MEMRKLIVSIYCIFTFLQRVPMELPHERLRAWGIIFLCLLAFVFYSVLMISPRDFNDVDKDYLGSIIMVVSVTIRWGIYLELIESSFIDRGWGRGFVSCNCIRFLQIFLGSGSRMLFQECPKLLQTSGVHFLESNHRFLNHVVLYLRYHLICCQSSTLIIGLASVKIKFFF